MNLLLRTTVLAVFALTVVVGCDSDQHGDPVISVADDDVAMNSAMETARGTFDKFLANWQTLPNDSANVKAGLETADGGVEHIWFTPTKITATEITGLCSNDAAGIPDLKYGDLRSFPRSRLSDWMIVVGDTCYGGYTIRVLSDMHPEEVPPMAFAEL